MSGGVFSSAPVLPVVIRPHPGESLAGWLHYLARFYRVSLEQYLLRLGKTPVPSKGRTCYVRCLADRELTVFPEPEFLQAIQVDTGVNMATLRAMTFIGVEEQLRSRCLTHDWVCTECSNDATERAGRYIDMRDERAAWRFFCPDHPLQVRSRYIQYNFPRELFYELVRKMHLALEGAAFGSAGAAGLFGPEQERCSVASFLAAAELFNEILVLEIMGFDEAAGRASFAVLSGLQRHRWKGDYRVSLQHDTDAIVPLVFAWQILQDPSMPVYCRAAVHSDSYKLLDEPRATALKRIINEARELLSYGASSLRSRLVGAE